ncbi:hypothetical protein N7478_007233 [Penicillium angulare]|uniref:uncharacterized protein n=1 Tax=Penicillium angulare TaxID=116970 RepID=UPI0025418E99|nr:uncharacterized protein N7478_007233 [Penicillium angulare]KAJ5281861.1 hypothetical protein N7478_007233 [Penicillium angulare]
MRTLSPLLALGLYTAQALSNPTPHSKSDTNTNNKNDYIDWRTFHAHGVNLGGWLEQESTIDTYWWAKECAGATTLCDLGEWGLCQHLGAQCGPVLEHRYATYITTEDIDKFASAGVTILRIPTTYAAWIDLPGSELYHGNQRTYIHRIATYAIEKHNMHILVDIHSLPGGTNGLDIGEATGHWGWWWNQTALDWSLRAVDALIDFVQESGHPESYSIEPINEPADNTDFADFGTAAALSDHGAEWLSGYIHKVIERVKKVNHRIPVMFQGSFKTEEYWSPFFEEGTNLVFDLHHYYYQYDNSTSENIMEFLCKDAKASKGDGKFPTFVGEWSIQTGANNSLGLRGKNVREGIEAWGSFTRGSSYWTGKYLSNATVEGEGEMGDYWNYEGFIDNGYFGAHVEVKDVCS